MDSRHFAKVFSELYAATPKISLGIVIVTTKKGGKETQV